MALIHPNSAPAANSSLATFLIPSTEISIEKTYNIPFSTIAPVNNADRHEFHIPPSEYYTDLSGICLEIQCKFKKGDDTDLGANEHVTPVNYLLNAMYEQADIYIGETKITAATNTYNLKSYIEAMLFKTKEAKSTLLQSAFWHEDEAERRVRADGSKIITLFGHPHFDIADQPRLLIPNVPLRFVFTRANDTKIISNATESSVANGVTTYAAKPALDPKCEVISARIWVPRVKVLDDVSFGVERKLAQNSTAKYYYLRSDVTTFNLGTAQKHFTQEGIIKGQLPRFLVFAIVKNSTLAGTKTTDLFKFENQNVTSFTVHVDADVMAGKPYEPDWANDTYAREFFTVYRELGMDRGEPTFDCSYADYKNKKCIYAFNLAPYANPGLNPDIAPMLRHGSVRAEIVFKEALTEPLTLIVYARYDKLLQIDQNRNIPDSF